MRAQNNYRYIRVAKIVLRNKSFLVLMESLNGDNAGSERLGSSHSDIFGLYTTTKEELPIFTTAARNFVKNLNRPDPFHASTFYTSTQTFLAEVGGGRGEGLRAVFIDHRTDSPSEFVESLNKAMYQTRTKSIPCCRGFSPACFCTAMNQETGREPGRLGSTVVSTVLSKTIEDFLRL